MACNPFSPALPTFDGAGGWGAQTRGAFTNTTTPTVRVVTSLLDDGSAGTLRYELTNASDDTLIIFGVSGKITLNNGGYGNYINVTANRVTIAGETAPTPGITIEGNIFFYQCSDVVMSHMRFFSNNQQYPDCISFEDVQMAMINRCTFGYSFDETVEIYGGSSDITFQRCLFAKPIKNSSEDANICLVDTSSRIAFLECYVSTFEFRAVLYWGPDGGDDEPLIYRNNIVYNVKNRAVQQGSFTNPSKMAVYNNVFKDGPLGPIAENYFIKGRDADGDWDGTEEIYVSLNMVNGVVSADQTTIVNEYSTGTIHTASNPFTMPGCETEGSLLMPVTSVEDILTDVGARSADRIPFETEAVADYNNNTGSFITTAGTSPVAEIVPSTASFSRTINFPTAGTGSTGYSTWEEHLALYRSAVEFSNTSSSDCQDSVSYSLPATPSAECRDTVSYSLPVEVIADCGDQVVYSLPGPQSGGEYCQDTTSYTLPYLNCLISNFGEVSLSPATPIYFPEIMFGFECGDCDWVQPFACSDLLTFQASIPYDENNAFPFAVNINGAGVGSINNIVASNRTVQTFQIDLTQYCGKEVKVTLQRLDSDRNVLCETDSWPIRVVSDDDCQRENLALFEYWDKDSAFQSQFGSSLDGPGFFYRLRVPMYSEFNAVEFQREELRNSSGTYNTCFVNTDKILRLVSHYMPLFMHERISYALQHRRVRYWDNSTKKRVEIVPVSPFRQGERIGDCPLYLGDATVKLRNLDMSTGC